MAQLVVSVDNTTTTRHLTTLGPTDWEHYKADQSRVRMTGTPNLLSDWSPVGSVFVIGFNGAPRGVDASNPSVNDADGILFGDNGTGGFNAGTGASWTCPADAGPAKTLTLLVGCYYCDATLTATLSDGSVSTQTDVQSNGGDRMVNYTITFQSNGPATLTLTWAMTANNTFTYSNVSVVALALDAPAAATFVPPRRQWFAFQDPDLFSRSGGKVAAILAPAPVVNSPVGSPRRPLVIAPDDWTAPGRSGPATIAAPYVGAPAGPTRQASQDWSTGPAAPPRTTGIPLLPPTAPIAQPPIARRSVDWSEPETARARSQPAAISAPAAVVPSGPSRMAAQDWTTGPLPPPRVTGVPVLPASAPLSQPPVTHKATDWPDDTTTTARSQSAAVMAPYVGAPAGPVKQPWQDWGSQTPTSSLTVGAPLLPATAPISQPPIARRPLDWEQESPPPDRTQIVAVVFVATTVVQPPQSPRQLPQFIDDPARLPSRGSVAAITATPPVVNNPPAQTRRSATEWDAPPTQPPPRPTVSAVTATPPVVNAPPVKRLVAPTDWSQADPGPARSGLVAAITALVAPLFARRQAPALTDTEAATPARPGVAAQIADTRVADPIPPARRPPPLTEEPWAPTIRQAFSATQQPSANASAPHGARSTSWLAEAAETLTAVRHRVAAIVAPPPPPPDAPPPRSAGVFSAMTEQVAYSVTSWRSKIAAILRGSTGETPIARVGKGGPRAKPTNTGSTRARSRG